MSNGFSKGLERLRIAQVIGGLWEGRLSAKADLRPTAGNRQQSASYQLFNGKGYQRQPDCLQIG